MIQKLIIQIVFFQLIWVSTTAQIKYKRFHDIPYTKGECLVVIKDTVIVPGLKTFALKQNPVFAAINSKYPIDQIEALRSKRNINARLQSSFSNFEIYKIRFGDPEISISDVILELKSVAGIVKIEPNYIFRSFETIPDEYSDRNQLKISQWALDNIKAPEGWDLETGDTSVIITILDSGVDWDHPDLQNNIWRNAGEIPGNSIDDDDNGYIDDYRGWDFVSAPIDQVTNGEDAEPRDNNPIDFNGHGTHVSGIAGAETNNHIGIAGLAWNCRIMPVRAGFERPDGSVAFSYADIVAGIYYAVENGTNIINMSFGESFIGTPGAESEIFTILKDAIDYAYDHNIVLVASAGNDPIAGLNTYPAAFDKVLSVASITYGNHKAPFSAFNSDWIDVAAPGVSIQSTFYFYPNAYDEGTYTHLDGTSTSAPFVSGLAALLKSHNASFSNTDIITIIKNEVDFPNDELYIGWGVINVRKALLVNNATNAVAHLISPQSDAQLFLDSIDFYGNISGDSYKIEFGEGIYPLHWTRIDSGTGNYTGYIATWNLSDIPNGKYTLRLSVTENERTISDRTTIHINRPRFPLLKGWPVKTSDEIHSNPVVADINNDGKSEIIVYASDGFLYVWNQKGIDAPGWPKYLGASRADIGLPPDQNWLMGTPAVSDIDNNGYEDIIVGTLDGKIVALNYTGESLPGFPVYLNGQILSSPTVMDLNNDGNPEIICRSYGSLNAISSVGEQLSGWPRPLSSNGQAVWSNQAVGDLDNDGDYEVIVGSEYYNNAEDRDNKLYAYHHNGELVDGWPVDLNPSGEYTGWVLSSPAVGDLDGNGTSEVVVGCDDNRLWVLKGNGTNFDIAWPKYLPYGFKASPAIADLDHDGDLEIVIGHRSDLNPGLRLYAFHHNGVPVNNWPYLADLGTGGFTFGWISPVIGDINNDDSLDVISISEVGSFLGTGGGDVYAIDHKAVLLEGFPLGLPKVSYSPVTISDVDGDHDVDLLAGDLSGQIFIWDLPYNYDKNNIPWGQFRHDNWNTGLYGFKPVPSRPLGYDVSVCQGAGGAVLTVPGDSIRWYGDSMLTNLLHSGNTFISGETEPATYKYWITQTVSGRESRYSAINLTINPLPVIFLGEDTTILMNQSITLGPFNNSYTYEWSNGSANTYVDIAASGIGLGYHNISVVVTDANSCKYSDTLKISVLKCEVRNTIVATMCKSYLSPSGKYTWTKPGEYHDTIPGTMGCDSLITINLTINSADTSVTQIDDVLKAEAAGASFQWINCDSNYAAIEGEIQPTFRPDNDGHYAVIVSQDGCTDTSSCYSVIKTGLSNDIFKNKIIIYPNPNDGSFSIDLGKILPKTDITIAELDGRIIKKEQSFNRRIIQMNISASPGMYVVIVTSANEMATFKILKK